MKIMTLIGKEAPANFVPAAAVIRKGRALFRIIGCKGFVDGFCCFLLNFGFIFKRAINTLLLLSIVGDNRISYIGVKSGYL